MQCFAQSEDWLTRQRLVEALRQLPSDKSVSALKYLEKDSHPNVAAAAKIALKPPTEPTPLETLCAGESSLETRVSRVSQRICTAYNLKELGQYHKAKNVFKDTISNYPNEIAELKEGNPKLLDELYNLLELDIIDYTEISLQRIYYDEILSFISRNWENLVVVALLIFIAGRLYIDRRKRVYLKIENINTSLYDLPDQEKQKLENINDQISTIIEEEIREFGIEYSLKRVDLVGQPFEAVVIPEIGFAPKFNLIFNLLDLAIPQRIVTLSCYLNKFDKKKGIGLTLVLNKPRQKLLSTHTLWQSDYVYDYNGEHGEEDFLKDTELHILLAKIVAVWTLFQVSSYTKDVSIRRKNLNIKEATGIQDWQSYAYFYAGVHWEERYGKKSTNHHARKMYIEAINRSTNNRFALFNLAIIDTIQDNQDSVNGKTLSNGESVQNYKRALERLCSLKDLLDRQRQTSQSNVDRLPIWYKTMYQIVALNSYIKILAPNDKNNNGKKAQKYAEELVYKILKINNTSYPKPIDINDLKAARDRFRKKYSKQTDERQRFLIWIEPMAIVLWAAVLVEQLEISDAKNLIDLMEPFELHYRARYNLACYYSRLGEKVSIICGRNDYYNKALSELEYALEVDSNLVEWSQSDPSLSGVREHKRDEYDKIVAKCRNLKKVL